MLGNKVIATSDDEGSNGLVLVFDTTYEAANNTIQLPLYGTVSCIVYWGDGSSNTYTTTGNKSKTYSKPGRYTVNIVGTLTRLGNSTTQVPNYYLKLVAVKSFGNIGLTSLNGAFAYCQNLEEVPLTLPSTVTDLANCFYQRNNTGAGGNLVNPGAGWIPRQIENWNTSNVTSMNSMFFDDKVSAALHPDADFSKWNTANVTDMYAMFAGQDNFLGYGLDNWNTGNVTDMGAMFYQCDSMYACNLNNWDVSKVTSMWYMFREALVFNSPLNSWNTSSVTNMAYMFLGADNN